MRAGTIVRARRAIQLSGRPLSATVRFRMRYSAVSLVVLIGAVLVGTVTAQTQRNCRIAIHSDGTCDAAGVHVPCSNIGPELRRAGVPLDVRVYFQPDKSANYAAVSAALESVTHAGFTNAKVGSVNVGASR
jgi:hypothetical protein